jgi:DNA invertase Pin-like site-specific DNA recombinase
MGKFFLNIMASLAQMERDLIIERTKDALRHKISRNERAVLPDRLFLETRKTGLPDRIPAHS